MNIQYKLKYPNLKKDIEIKKIIHSITDRNIIKNIQISKLNYTWSYSYSKYSFYKKIKQIYNLPDYIENIEQLKTFPIMNKNLIKKYYKSIISESDYKNISQTGGTSGSFVGFPTNFNDQYFNILRTFFYRNYIHQINSNKCLYIWGHSHKFGSFLKKYKNIAINNFKDFVNNRERINAYDLSHNHLNQIYKKIIKNKIETIIVYGSTLEVILDYFKLNDYIINQPIKIIVTSDNISSFHIQKFSKIFLNSLLINEYGMAETGVIGYSKFNFNSFNIFWDDFILEPNNNKLLITTLNSTCFPLFRYDPDDTINESYDKYPIFLLKGLVGKVRPNIEFINNDKKFSTVIFDHILKNHNKITDFQYSFKGNKFKILYQSNQNLDKDLKDKITKILKFDITNKIEILKKNNLSKTIAGKRMLILS